MKFDPISLQNTLVDFRFWLAAVGLAAFASLFNFLIDRLDGTNQDNNAILVVVGVLAVLFAYALVVSFEGAIQILILFAAAGLPMIIGEYRRRVNRIKKTEESGVRVGYTSGQLVDLVTMRLETILHELLPMINREYKPGPTELCQRAATSIDQAHRGINELKAIPRARATKGKD